jgi:CRP-like cAMP-binding protein
VNVDILKLCEFGEFKRFNDGEYLYKEGDDVNGLCYLIVDGSIEESKSFDLDNAFVRDIETGDVAGIIEIFSGDKKRLTGLKACNNLKTYIWSRKGIEEIASSNIRFCFFIIKKLSMTLRGLDFEFKEFLLRSQEK